MTNNDETFAVIFEGIEKRAAAAIKKAEEDYIGEDGLLICGKCHTPKQSRIEIFGSIRTPMCLCKCATEKRDAEAAERKRQEEMLRIEKMRHRGFPESEMRNWNFNADDAQNEKISKVAHNYVDNFKTMLEKGKGLLFFGTVGTGKTFYSACIVNALIDKGYPCLMTNFSRLVNTISGMYEGKQDYLDSLNRYALLVIDDLAAERDTEYMNEIVQNIIDSRYRAGLPTIITTNLTSEEIKNPADIRKQRTYSRLLEMCIPVEVKGNDRRREKLISDYAEFNDLLGL